MRYWHYISALVCTAMMAACSDSESQGGKTDELEEGRIGFTMSVKTRSVFTGTEFPTTEAFGVWAWEEGETQPFIAGDAVRYRDDLGAWSTDARYIWPRGNITFCAVYPASMAFDADSRTVAYTVPAITASQTDILYDMLTTSKGDEKVMYNSVRRYSVPIKFRHALSQIAFRGRIKEENQDWTVDISDLTLCNVASQGVFSLSTGTWGSITGLQDYSIGMNSSTGSLTYGSTAYEAADLTAADGSLLLIPQQLYPWDADSNVASQDGAYIAVTCHIYNNVSSLFGTAASHITVYVPFDNSGSPWEPGRKYVYTLNFGAGLDANGKSHLEPIEITTEITDWTEGTGGDLDAEMTHE